MLTEGEPVHMVVVVLAAKLEEAMVLDTRVGWNELTRTKEREKQKVKSR